MLEHDLRQHKIDNVGKLFDSPNNALVLVSGFIPAGARRHAARFSWDRTVDALVEAYSSAAEEMATALPLSRERSRGPLRAVPGVQVAR